MKQKSLKFKEAQERMRYEFFNHLSDDELFNPLLADDENYAYVLEKNGPCSIAGELKLRIPEGRYEVSWHNGTRRKQTLKLHNAYISAQRYILIHEGYTKENSKDQEGSSPRNTFGCLIIAKDRIRDKNNPRLFADNILKADS
ncbi:DUF5675 family protein, partial [Campylobacter troglodytis]|uniref:DUF5675 family protein n=1 Tax=Campylobacter troglodytis TaxID=654363 RepID=UPI001C8D8BC3